jgi:pimeloyl-ACP methyl ester carboxylesterase
VLRRETVRQVLAHTVGEGVPTLVVSHDLGDTVMLELLASTPGCVSDGGSCPFAAVVMLNGGVLPSVHRAELAQVLLQHPWVGPWLQHLMIRPVFGLALSRVFGPHTKPSTIELDEDFALTAHNGGIRLTHAHMQYRAERVVNSDRWVGAMGEARCPVLFLNGPADPVSGAHMATAVGQTVPRVDIMSLPSHVGHFPQREMPPVTAARIESWFKELELK